MTSSNPSLLDDHEASVESGVPRVEHRLLAVPRDRVFADLGEARDGSGKSCTVQTTSTRLLSRPTRQLPSSGQAQGS